jgi:hypothetical protein
MRAIPSAFILIFLSVRMTSAQSTQPEVASGASGGAPVKIALGVPAGTPLRVVLDREVRIRKAGQPIRGKIAEPVYAYDKLVIPAGSEVIGSLTRLSGVTLLKRVRAGLDANFSPKRDVEIAFDQLALPNGQSVHLHTQVTPGSEGVLKFAIAADIKNPPKEKKKNGAKELVSKKVNEKKQEVSQEWETAKKQFVSPGKIHRLERLALSRLPFHSQYLDAGTRFNAELVDPLDFGSEELSAEKIRMVGTTPADGSIVHALLMTPLDSATSSQGETVEAMMTEPLIADSNLILPEGTILRGSVLQVQPARNLHRNGQLRIVFHEIAPPESAERHIEASLEGVEAKRDENLTLDAEGGGQASSPKTRYLSAAVSITVAGFSSDDLLNRTLDGGSAYSLIGLAVGALSRSQPLAIGLGVFGASKSVYKNFLSRGRDVVYPKDTAMAVGFGSRVTKSPKTGTSGADAATDRSVTASK